MLSQFSLSDMFAWFSVVSTFLLSHTHGIKCSQKWMNASGTLPSTDWCPEHTKSSFFMSTSRTPGKFVGSFHFCLLPVSNVHKFVRYLSHVVHIHRALHSLTHVLFLHFLLHFCSWSATQAFCTGQCVPALMLHFLCKCSLILDMTVIACNCHDDISCPAFFVGFSEVFGLAFSCFFGQHEKLAHNQRLCCWKDASLCTPLTRFLFEKSLFLRSLGIQAKCWQV